MAKASNLASGGLTPTAAAARSSSRTAAHALPVRDPANRSAAAHARAARTSASAYPFSGELGPQSPNWGNGTPLIPRGPPDHGTCNRTPGTIAPNARVTTARYSPRARIVGTPKASPNPAASSAAMGSASHGSRANAGSAGLIRLPEAVSNAAA